mgnify:CR=1 FL=1
MKYFDPIKKRLVFVGSKATSDFWDEQWKANGEIRREIIKIRKTFVSEVTKKFLRPEEGCLLEGGCGRGFNVMSLINNGYKCIGVDYAPKTVEVLNRALPEIEIKLADIRCLPFEDGLFAGYWSWGVIEHFYDGYEDVLDEIYRVIKDRGYLFLVFPYMSFFRKLKAVLGFYPLWHSAHRHGNFYQFALNAHSVISDFRNKGFVLVKALPLDGIKGIKDEMMFIKPLFQRMYSYKGSSILLKMAIRIINFVVSPLAGHSILLILQKAGSSGRVSNKAYAHR